MKIYFFVIRTFRPKKTRTAWELPVGLRVDKKNNILPYIIAFYRDNDLKLKFVRGKKVDILTKEANAKIFWNQSKKNFGLKKAYFLGHPVVQAVEAQNAWTFLQKIHILTK